MKYKQIIMMTKSVISCLMLCLPLSSVSEAYKELATAYNKLK